MRLYTADMRVIAVAEEIAKEIIYWCPHHYGSPRECLMHHIENTESYDMYVPPEYEMQYRRLMESPKAAAALDRAVQARLRKALAKAKSLW
jgi:hypothetical protein